MNKTMKAVLAVTLSSSLVLAKPPSATVVRHAEVEAALKQNATQRSVSNVVIGGGAAALVVASVATVVGVGTELSNVGKAATTVAVSPYFVLAGAGVPKAPEPEDSTAAFTTALVSAVVGAAAVTGGLVARETLAPAAEKKALERERAQLAAKLRAEEEAELTTLRTSLAAPSLLPSEVPVSPR